MSEREWSLPAAVFAGLGLAGVVALVGYTLFVGVPRDRFDIDVKYSAVLAIDAAKDAGAPVEVVKIKDGSLRLFPTVQSRANWHYFLATADAKRGEAIAREGTKAGAAACSGCHGEEGQPDPGNGFPRLAGMDTRYVAAQLTAYADGARENEVMSGIAKALTNQDITDLSLYYNGLRTPANTSAGDATLVVRGRLLHEQGDNAIGLQPCNACHGVKGGGGLPYIPFLAGQDVDYLAVRLNWFKGLKRKTQSQAQMAAVAKHLSDADIKAVAAYYSSLSNLPIK